MTECHRWVEGELTIIFRPNLPPAKNNCFKTICFSKENSGTAPLKWLWETSEFQPLPLLVVAHNVIFLSFAPQDSFKETCSGTGLYWIHAIYNLFRFILCSTWLQWLSVKNACVLEKTGWRQRPANWWTPDTCTANKQRFCIWDASIITT